MAINKQPVFTTTPILTLRIYDPEVVTAAYNPSSCLTSTSKIFTSTDSYGTLIERITVSSTGDTSYTTVTAKLIYLYLYYDVKSSWSLYKTAAMPALTISDTTPNAEIEWVFTGGLLLPVNFQIFIGASTNSVATGQKGDYLSVTVEGSTYTQV